MSMSMCMSMCMCVYEYEYHIMGYFRRSFIIELFEEEVFYEI